MARRQWRSPAEENRRGAAEAGTLHLDLVIRRARRGRLSACGLTESESFDGGGDAAFIVGKRFVPAVDFEFRNAVGHDDGNTSYLEHFEIVVVVPHGENFFALQA